MRAKQFCAILVLLGILAAVVFAATGCVLLQKACTIQVTPEGEENTILEYGQTYEEKGATALLYLEDQEPAPLDVLTEGEVNDQKVGTYLIRYTAQYDGYVGTAYRRVQLVDTEAPVITLVSDPNHYTLPNQTYQEEGFTATDNYDGDLTASVRRTETVEAVTYTVRDSSGNETTIVRPIVYNDPVPPEMTLYGDSMVVITAGEAYKEPGYLAMDNCDGDITQSVTVTGGVNIYVPGSYKLTYTVQDAYANSATATRTVFVKQREVEKVNDATTTTAEKVIYLTFDDGPGPHTARLLDILKKYNVQASFFVVNTAYISTIQRAAAEGHTVAMHSMTHKYKSIYASEEAFFADLYGMQSIIQSHTGQAPMLMRFPGGGSNTISSFNEGIMTRLTQMVAEQGFVYFDWNVDSKDAGGAKTASAVYNNVVRGVGSKKKAVVLMHDIMSYTVDAIESIIIWGLENGYTFLPLTDTSPTCHHAVNN